MTIKKTASIGAALCLLILIWQLVAEALPAPSYIKETFPTMREAQMAQYAGKPVSLNYRETELVLRYYDYTWEKVVKLKLAVWCLMLGCGALFVLIVRRATKEETSEKAATGEDKPLAG
ncbi:hypothetical protein [Haloferula sp. A504]|uniref:hypothetical protein n=1 Tax=Haloferula sp. A504 TaxID=3373601 RepID=UPI0031C7B1A2|nr:hypothetical protein [Verrucomicrobiaceae bacterium E54]